MQFDSGAVGHLTGSYDMSMLHPIEWCEAAGSEGRLIIENVYESITYYPHRSEEMTVFRNPIMRGMEGFDDTFNRRLERFIEQVKNGTPPEDIEASGADALAAQEVIEAAIESQQSGERPLTCRSRLLARMGKSRVLNEWLFQYSNVR
ncbi:hypothetical protein LJK87_20195 [Paenibacillus sp. P25]|nr:hypothetical protein LJK87_20195 [Paenibacillus sp. P25]